MKLALTLSYSGAQMSLDMERILEVERLGFDSVWSAESYGSDAVTPAAWIAARTTRIHVGTGIMQLAGRSPAATAMTAMTLDALSGGRFRLGLGVSGPQVVEGWHGQPFGKPLARTREYVEIVRRVFRREKPLEFRGEYYQIPYTGPEATGLGKPLKSSLHGRPAATSTTTSRAATATRRPPRRSRTSTSRAAARRPRPRCRTRSWTRSRSAGRASGSASDSPSGRGRGSPRC